MDDRRVRVITRQDEYDDYISSLFGVFFVLFICVCACVGISKALGFSTNTGWIGGLIVWALLVAKIKWMRDVVLRLAKVFLVAFVLIGGIILCAWVFK